MYKTYMVLITTLLMLVATTANAGGKGKNPTDMSIYEIANSTTIHTTLVALLDRILQPGKVFGGNRLVNRLKNQVSNMVIHFQSPARVFAEHNQAATFAAR